MFSDNVEGTVTRAQRPAGKIVGTLARGGLLVLLALGLSSCGVTSNSTQGTGSPKTVSADSAVPAPQPPRTEFKTGEAVPAGYLGYKVFASWFSEGAESYLYVDLAIVNTDKKERAVSPLKVIDEAGKEYALSEKFPAKGEGVLKVGKISPNVSKRAMALFEVPKGHEYKLKIQGFSATDEVQITLQPAAAPSSP